LENQDCRAQRESLELRVKMELLVFLDLQVVPEIEAHLVILAK